MASTALTPDVLRCSDHMYAIGDSASLAVKIGRAVDPEVRVKQLQTGSPTELFLWKSIKGAGFLETVFHGLFSDEAIRGEWYPERSVAVAVLESWSPIFADVPHLLCTFGEAVDDAAVERGVVAPLLGPGKTVAREAWAEAEYDTVAEHYDQRGARYNHIAVSARWEKHERFGDGDGPEPEAA